MYYNTCCPICGEELKFELGYSCGSPVVHLFCVKCNYDSWNESTTVTTNTPIDFNDSRTPISNRALTGGSNEMRNETPEEQKRVMEYLKKISKDTGENFWDLCENSVDGVKVNICGVPHRIV